METVRKRGSNTSSVRPGQCSFDSVILESITVRVSCRSLRPPGWMWSSSEAELKGGRCGEPRVREVGGEVLPASGRVAVVSLQPSRGILQSFYHGCYLS